MTVGDGLAIYGAVLATIIAIVQIVDWRSKRRPFSVTALPELERDEAIELEITCKTEHPTEVTFVGIGYTYQPWKKPWIREAAEVVELKKISDGKLSDHGVFRAKLKPGATLECHIRRDDWRHIDLTGTSYSGFGFRHSLYIEHTLNEYPYVRLF